ncbi:hypothetical protein NDU88_006464 [Pleurodeles waltl]|uniref:Cadherin domain-containing protein n=1 Tax=Pleurodeles waltl TaxID=8319 RepID=A0AAV7PL42_PLEWA|nr:hypothetical protein NDU88_006464 [Pleurodeles waltl]
MVQKPRLCFSGFQFPRLWYSGAVTSRRCYSGGETPKRCYSGALTPRRLQSGAQASRRCYSGAQTSRHCCSRTQTPRRCYSGTPMLLLAALLTVCAAASGQLRYSIPEEMRKGSFIGNVALDLGVDSKDLSEGGARIEYRGRKQYFALDSIKTHLIVNERIDREEVCGRAVPCLLQIEIILERILKVYAVKIEIQDINDNPPTFIADQITLHVIENTAPSARFELPGARDEDVGNNSLQHYQLNANKHFTLDVNIRADGTKHAELVLENLLDREEQDVHHLILTAIDGGNPARSGTAQIKVIVLDANDNAPIFDKSVYKVSVLENAPKGTTVTAVRAVDIDQELNSEVSYSFSNAMGADLQTFTLNSKTGEIVLRENLDFEVRQFYEFEVRGSDGSFSSKCKVLIEVLNVNDNAPEIILSSLLSQVAENSPVGTVIALLRVFDQDAGEYGKVTCSLPPHLPFHLKKSIGTYYSLVTSGVLDREDVQEYNITINATDYGTPTLFKAETLHLRITDENDNPPVFSQSSYNAYIMENIFSGTSIFEARANDLDVGHNAKITYSIAEGHIKNVLFSSYISINSDSGVIYALHSFDFEDFREFQIRVKAQDGGTPALMSNATVTFFIQDQNDNTPEILYPSPPTDGSSGVEMAPRSSEPGYLITKVVAVDTDSGQNSWLSYQLLRSTDHGLFSVGLHTGEIRTARPIIEKDALKHFLVVLVKDNGQTPLSSSVTVPIVLADSMPEMLHDISSPSVPADIESNLTLYLVIALAVVSFLFLFLIILLLAIRIHRWRESQFRDTSGVNFNAPPPSQFVGIDGVRAFLETYSHDVYLTKDSGKSHLKVPFSMDSNTLSRNQNFENQESVLTDDFLCIGTEDQPFVQIVAINNKDAECRCSPSREKRKERSLRSRGTTPPSRIRAIEKEFALTGAGSS